MNVLIVFDHPRRNSLSGAVLSQFVEGLEEAGHTKEIADLHSEKFDPRMPPTDEPNLSGGKKPIPKRCSANRPVGNGMTR